MLRRVWGWLSGAVGMAGKAAGLIGPKVWLVTVAGMGVAILFLWQQYSAAEEARASYKAGFEEVAETARSNAKAADRFRKSAAILAETYKQRERQRAKAEKERRRSEAALRTGLENANAALRACLARDLPGGYYRGLWPGDGIDDGDQAGQGLPAEGDAEPDTDGGGAG
mgnify:CR=1 FL=1